MFFFHFECSYFYTRIFVCALIGRMAMPFHLICYNAVVVVAADDGVGSYPAPLVYLINQSFKIEKKPIYHNY